MTTSHLTTEQAVQIALTFALSKPEFALQCGDAMVSGAFGEKTISATLQSMLCEKFTIQTKQSKPVYFDTNSKDKFPILVLALESNKGIGVQSTRTYWARNFSSTHYEVEVRSKLITSRVRVGKTPGFMGLNDYGMVVMYIGEWCHDYRRFVYGGLYRATHGEKQFPTVLDDYGAIYCIPKKDLDKNFAIIGYIENAEEATDLSLVAHRTGSHQPQIAQSVSAPKVFATCKDNYGYEEHFMNGGVYEVAKQDNDMIEVVSSTGAKVECMSERFEIEQE